ncbi:MAG TPA: MYXO-CTERM sorting domain-containing protein [Enhygromyxa sp.]|nr:MYXO-CTERM sorting domain-containing protein [Enhygromyxa sp.]
MQVQLLVPMLVWLANPEPRLYDPGVVHVEDGSTPAELERFRIQRHLALVEDTLRRETPPDLTEGPALARARLLDELHRYAERGEFPQNLDFPDRRIPYFIDEFGTACAVGHLMIVSGAEQLAHEIARDENNDVVAEIEHPGVGPWLAANGLTAAEAAWIQPSYGPCGFDGEVVCGSDGVTYACEYVATECAMVEVDHEGACNEGDEVVDVEICPATEDTGSTEDTSTAEDESKGGEPAERKGCSVGGAGPGGLGFGLGLLALVAIRRRRRVCS